MAKKKRINYITLLASRKQEAERKIYGDTPLLSAATTESYEKTKQAIADIEEEQRERVMQRLAAQGIVGAGVGGSMMAKYVDKPILQARVQLESQRLAAESAEKTERGRTALGMASQAIAMEEKAAKEDEARKAATWEKVGGIIGTVGGAVVGFVAGGPVGAATGAIEGKKAVGGIAKQTGDIFGAYDLPSPGEGATDEEMIAAYNELLGKMEKDPNVDFNKVLSSLHQYLYPQEEEE